MGLLRSGIKFQSRLGDSWFCWIGSESETVMFVCDRYSLFSALSHFLSCSDLLSNSLEELLDLAHLFFHLRKFLIGFLLVLLHFFPELLLVLTELPFEFFPDYLLLSLVLLDLGHHILLPHIHHFHIVLDPVLHHGQYSSLEVFKEGAV